MNNLIFEPINEMHFRQLFFGPEGSENHPFRYLGPCMDGNGKIQSSPDSLVFDIENDLVLRAEFKNIVRNISDFKDNGQFDIAICWKCQGNRTEIIRELENKHGCNKLFEMSTLKNFQNIPDYCLENIQAIKSDVIKEKYKKNFRKDLLGSRLSRPIGVAYAASYVFMSNQARSAKEIIEYLESIKVIDVTLDYKTKLQRYIISMFQLKLIEKVPDNKYRWNHQKYTGDIVEEVFSELIPL